jgi:uridine kinase
MSLMVLPGKRTAPGTLPRIRQMDLFESVSTWRQPVPSAASAERSALIGQVAEQIASLGSGRLRVAVDGLTASGKTSFGHELAAALGKRGRPVMRASLDDFKHPWRHAREHGYDRLSGEGYYRNPWDFASARQLLLRPAGPVGSGVVVLCAHDPLTGEDHRGTMVTTPPATILIVDGVFAFRPEYNDCWEYRIWLEVDPAAALGRGIARDTAAEGAAEATRVHRDRYHAAERIYQAEVGPEVLADLVIDNNDFGRARVLRCR